MNAHAFRTDQDELTTLRRRVRELEDELAAYQANSIDDQVTEREMDELAAVRIALGVKRSTARILLAMAKRPGKYFTKEMILRAQGAYEDALPVGATVSICYARRGLAALGLDGELKNMRGSGYWLTKSAAAAVLAIISARSEAGAEQ